MRRFISNIKSRLNKEGQDDIETEDGYVELSHEGEDSNSKVIVRPFTLKEFEDVKEVLESLRKGNTIGLVNIKPLKEKDILELKRAINKLKKTCDADEGEIAGFGEDWIVVTPSFATIYKTKQTEDIIKDEDLE